MYSFENIKLKLDNIGIMHRMIASNKEQLGGKGDKGTTIIVQKESIIYYLQQKKIIKILKIIVGKMEKLK